MTSEISWRDLLSRDGDVQVIDGVVSVAGVAVGMLAPSTIFGFDPAGRRYAWGRAGQVALDDDSQEAVYEALLQSDSICFGDATSVAACASLLKDERTSRTTSYLLSLGGTCNDVAATVTRIRDASVLVVGCGGIGALLAMNLCGAGVGRLHLVDSDVVERSNLNRQFFWSINDVSRLKCTVLKEQIAARYPDVNVVTSTTPLSAENAASLVRGHEAIVVTADEPLGIAAHVATVTEALVVNAGYVHGTSYYTVVTKSAADAHAPTWERNPWFVGPSFGPSNTELAGVVSALVLKHVANPGEKPAVLECSWNSMDIPRVLTTTVQ
ncbi:ThiF family adenylyltransferase [Burkholderia perseverans]|uniref:ThiF family adenylyltransferase n=1 Tax=Burkholderia perseverans TaxID=2615214 RepID=UPI001FEDC5C4|nr:ThiF family adenylyltransferase [Burkholderia perseverans]